MTDLDAIRARHVPYGDGPVEYCRWDDKPWPCDTATVLAALDEERQGAETEGAAVVLALGAKIVAAEAREARLREALDSIFTEAERMSDEDNFAVYPMSVFRAIAEARAALTTPEADHDRP